MRFIGRERELAALKAFYAKGDENLAVVYGRRRIGKTQLLRASLEEADVPVLFLQCKETSVEGNVRDLMELAEAALGIRLGSLTDPEEALRILFEVAVGRRILLVLDEYPYLRSLIPGGDSMLQGLLDRYRERSGLKVVLCGSYLDIMRGIVEYRSPLYGRAGLSLQLEPMDYFDASLFYPDFSNEDKVRLYAVFGGVPYYNAKIDPSVSVVENIRRLIASKDSVFGNEAAYLLHLELGKISNAVRVFEAIAGGARKFSDILDRSGVSSSPVLADVLKRLTEMGLLRKVTPINQPGNKKRTTYVVADRLIGFHYRYLYRYLSQLAQFRPEDFWSYCVEEDFETQYVPEVFEDMGRQYLVRLNLAGRIRPPFFRIGSYWYDLPKERRNGEFDIVTEGPGGYGFFECKFRNHPMTEAEIRKEIEEVRASPLQASHFGFISKSGFRNAEASPDRTLLTLDDLYTPL